MEVQELTVMFYLLDNIVCGAPFTKVERTGRPKSQSFIEQMGLIPILSIFLSST